MRRVVSAREQVEMTSPWLKTADDEDLMAGPTLAPATPAVAPAKPPAAPLPPALDPNLPPTITDIPREEFDSVLASKGVTYDEHLDHLESHFNAANEEQQRRGRVWYRAGGDIIRDISNKFGISVKKGISMAAALSGRTDWNDNLHFFAHLAGNYRPGENEEEWRRAAIHPSALARYMEDHHGIVPGEKGEGDLTNPGHFTAKELDALKQGGYMPRTKAQFESLAAAHGGNHWQYAPRKINPQTGKKGVWFNAPLAGFGALQTTEGRKEWLRNALISQRGDRGIRNKDGDSRDVDRDRYEDVIDAHIRNVDESLSPYGHMPRRHFMPAGLPTLTNNTGKAKMMMALPEDADFEKHLKGPKYRAFFANLGNKLGFRKANQPSDQGYYDLGGRHWTELDPEFLRSTVDTQHMRAASQPHGSTKPVPGYSKSSVVTDKQYEVYQQGLIDLTHRINSKRPQHMHLLPHQVQAVIWGKFKDDMDAIKPSAGQKYWSPVLDDIQPFADRYRHSRRRVALATHIHPRLLEPPASDPYETDSDEWFEAALGSWFDNHQHELAEGGAVMTQQARREINAARRAIAQADALLGQRPPPTAKYVLLPHWDPEACAEILRGHAGTPGRIAAPLAADPKWDKDVMDAANDGGFTFHDHVGDGPRDGYMVSLYKNCETKLPMQELTAEHVRDFSARHADLLARPHHYLGGWLEKGHFYLDVSVHVPEVDQALRDAIRARQLGVYDVTKQRTLDTEQEGWLRGLPGVVGSRHGQRKAAVPHPAQGRPAAGGGHPAQGRRHAADDADERNHRVAQHLDAYSPPTYPGP